MEDAVILSSISSSGSAFPALPPIAENLFFFVMVVVVDSSATGLRASTILRPETPVPLDPSF